MPGRRILIVCVGLLMLLSLGYAGASSARSARASTAAKHRKPSGGALAAIGTEPNPSIFGIDTNEFDSNAANVAKDIPTARSLGARYVHLTLGAATATGNFRIDDMELKQARRHHLGVMLSLGGVASACSIRPMPADVHACPPTNAGDLRAYKSYLRKVLLHYRNVVVYFESWTEENTKVSWASGPNPGQYAALLKAQWSVFQSVNEQYHKHMKLLFGSPVDFSIPPGNPRWLAVLPYTQEVLADLHGAEPFNDVAVHAYRVPPRVFGPSVPTTDYVQGIPLASGSKGPFPADGCSTSSACDMTWPEELEAYEQLFTNHGYGQPPLWLTEFGWPGTANPSGNDYPSDAQQAADLRGAYDALLQLPFVKAAFWFNLRDYQPNYPSGDPAYFYFYGLLDYNFTQKPSAGVFTALARANPGR